MQVDKNLQIINIENNEVPIIHIKTNCKKSHLFGVQGIVTIVQSSKQELPLRTVINEQKEVILDCYKSMTKPVILDRSEDEYLKLCQKYIDHYTKKLDITPKKIRHNYIKTDHLGWAYINNTITYNMYMRYMTEEQIKLTIYHELCHIYTLQKFGTFEHNQEFFDILYKEFTPEEEAKILQN